MANGYDIFQQILQDKPVAFHPQMARSFGGIGEALLFQQLAFCSDKGKVEDWMGDERWIYKTQREIEEETCLTRSQQESARRSLGGLGIVDETRRSIPAKLYYRVVWEAVWVALEAAADKDAGDLHFTADGPGKDAENLQPSMLGSSRRDAPEPAAQPAQKPQSLTERTSGAITENDLEISKDTPTRFKGSTTTWTDGLDAR